MAYTFDKSLNAEPVEETEDDDRPAEIAQWVVENVPTPVERRGGVRVGAGAPVGPRLRTLSSALAESARRARDAANEAENLKLAGAFTLNENFKASQIINSHAKLLIEARKQERDEETADMLMDIRERLARLDGDA